MDRILLIDFQNALWRASTNFAGSIQHQICQETCNHKLATSNILHCVCGAKWHLHENFCYGEQFFQIYNFFRNLRPLVEDFYPDKLFFVLEGRPHFRYQLLSEYKANRIIKTAASKTSKDEPSKNKAKKQGKTQADLDKLYQSSEQILRILLHFPCTIVRAENYECDDLIGTLCDNMKEEDLTVISNDSDYIQLLQRNYSSCHIYNPIKKDFMTAPKYPYIAWKALHGDKSDNIPHLTSPTKSYSFMDKPELFRKFMEVSENNSRFQINRQLIEFHTVPEEEIIVQEGISNFPQVQQEFALMEFQSIINSESWQKYIETFNCIRF